jgi:hypothetical protein
MRDAVGPFSAFEASQTHIQAGGTGAAGESSLGVSGVGTARLSLRRRPPKGGIENTIPRRLSSLTFTSTLGSQSKRATI